jgi:heme exporter protein A
MKTEKTTPEVCAIEARGLEKSFGEHRALAGVDLKVAGGECLVIFGPNGAGKTTLLKVLSTLMKPSSGIVLLEGVDARAEPVLVRRRLSLVSHETFLYDNLTLYENLKFYGKMYDVPELERRIGEVTAMVRLESRLHDRVGTLSRGLQQRASFARAVLHQPSILFLDEPDIGLDPRAGAIVDEVIGSTGPDRPTVVMTTHNLERGMELAGSIVILHRGRVVYQASGDEMKRENIRPIYDRYTEEKR